VIGADCRCGGRVPGERVDGWTDRGMRGWAGGRAAAGMGWVGRRWIGGGWEWMRVDVWELGRVGWGKERGLDDCGSVNYAEWDWWSIRE
jgi:hypothetical protein